MEADAELRADGEETARSALTRRVVAAYRAAWRQRDATAMAALFAPDAVYVDHFQRRRVPGSQIEAYLRAAMPPPRRAPLQLYRDRLRVDGDTAFLRYRMAIPDMAAHDQAGIEICEIFELSGERIVAVEEMCSLALPELDGGQADRRAAPRPAALRLGLSLPQIGALAADLDDYFAGDGPVRRPDLQLADVARETGYTRNQISYYFNTILGTRFLDFVNARRLAVYESLRRARPRAPAGGLAQAAGFGSLSTFYRVRQRLHGSGAPCRAAGEGDAP